jgi:hypothetical protein
MDMTGHLLLTGLFSILFGTVGQAVADPIDISARFVRPDGSPISGMDVRVVVGSEKSPRARSAGKHLLTDADSRVRRRLDAAVGSRRVSLDNFFARHSSRHLEIGVEMDLVGRPALYWIELDLVREGTVGGISAYVQDATGRFNRKLGFDSQTHSWRFPDKPDGMLMSSMGANMKFHELTGSAEAGWTVRLEIAKHQFTVR